MKDIISHNKVEIYGLSYCDYIWIYNQKATQQEIDSVVSNYNEPEWINNTLLLALFNDDINGGNVTNLQENILSWLIYRQELGSSVLEYVTEIPADKTDLVDYNVENNKYYKYIIFPTTENTIGVQFSSDDYTYTNWWDWVLLGLTQSKVDNLFYVNTKNIWRFELDVQGQPLAQNIDVAERNSNLKYTNWSFGKKNYLTGGLTGYLGRIDNGEYIDSANMREKFSEFLGNNSLKLLKDRKGNIFLIDIVDSNFKFLDEVESQPLTVTFSFVELGSTKGLSIIEE